MTFIYLKPRLIRKYILNVKKNYTCAFKCAECKLLWSRVSKLLHTTVINSTYKDTRNVSMCVFMSVWVCVVPSVFTFDVDSRFLPIFSSLWWQISLLVYFISKTKKWRRKELACSLYSVVYFKSFL